MNIEPNARIQEVDLIYQPDGTQTLYLYFSPSYNDPETLIKAVLKQFYAQHSDSDILPEEEKARCCFYQPSSNLDSIVQITGLSESEKCLLLPHLKEHIGLAKGCKLPSTPNNDKNEKAQDQLLILLFGDDNALRNHLERLQNHPAQASFLHQAGQLTELWKGPEHVIYAADTTSKSMQLAKWLETVTKQPTITFSMPANDDALDAALLESCATRLQALQTQVESLNIPLY